MLWRGGATEPANATEAGVFNMRPSNTIRVPGLTADANIKLNTSLWLQNVASALPLSRETIVCVETSDNLFSLRLPPQHLRIKMKNCSNRSRKPEDIAKQFEALQKLRRQVYQAELKALRDVQSDAPAKADAQMIRPQKPSGAKPRR